MHSPWRRLFTRALVPCVALFSALLGATLACDRNQRLTAPDVTGLEARVEGGAVHLTWSRTTSSTRARVLRRLDLPPEGPDDTSATVVFDGNAAVADDDLRLLLPSTATEPRTYHYAAFPCVAGRGCASVTTARAAVSPTLVQCLRVGGYSIWWRHSSATQCSDRVDLGTAATTSVPNWWKSCDPDCPPTGGATARQLNAAGVTEAVALGQIFDALGIPLGRVISSEYCRCFHTAELMDFGPTIEQDPGITYFVYDEATRCDSSMVRIARLPPPGTNAALIGHAGFTGTCPVLGELLWSEAAIFKPAGDGTALLIARVPWDQWPAPAPVP